MPDLLLQTMLPSPSFCCSVGRQGRPPWCSRAPQVETARTPGADTAEMEDWRVLGEDDPQVPGPRLDKGTYLCCGLCRCASPALLQPRAASLFPVLKNRAPKGSSLCPAALPAPTGMEGSQQPWHSSACVSLSASAPQGSWLEHGNGRRGRGTGVPGRRD